VRLFRFVAFTVVRAWQGFWRNAMMSLAATATVVLMLVLLSGLFIVLGGLNSGLAFIESKVGVTARLLDDLPQEEVDALMADIRVLPGVKKVDYVSPELALERLRACIQAFQMARRPLQPHRTAVAVRCMRTRDIEQHRRKRPGKDRIVARRHGADRVAVVRMMQRDEGATRRLTAVAPVLPRQLHGDFNSRRPVVGVEHAGERRGQ